MGESEPAARAAYDAEHAIRRSPDLQVVSPGAQVRYVCDWTGRGPEPNGTSDSAWGPRDGVRWYSYNDQPPRGFDQRQITIGPLTPSWERTWDEKPGLYTVVAEIRSRWAAAGAAPSYCCLSQQIGDTGALLKDWLDRLMKSGRAPSPEDAEKNIARYREVLDEVAKKHPPPDRAGADAHAKDVDKWRKLAERLRGLLKATDGAKRIPVPAIHLETATQARRPLFLFLAEMGEVLRPVRGGVRAQKRWVLVDWTNPDGPRFRGSYQGEGSDAAQAIEGAFRSWDWENRYPAGSLTFELPAELRGLMSGPVRRQLDTNGTSLTEEVVAFLEWIAVGTTLIAGFCFIFVAIPWLEAGAAALGMAASTASATLSVGQRWRDGIFDWRADAIDGLTVVGNLIGAGAWARGARVRLPGAGRATLDYVFFGARVGSDAARGVLVLAKEVDDLNGLLKDPRYSPEQRTRELLLRLGKLAASSAMAAMTFRLAAKERETLTRKPRHLEDDPRSTIPEEELRKLTDPEEIVDKTVPPIAEGRPNEGPHRTVVTVGIEPAPVKLKPEETEFAQAYPEEEHPWETRIIDSREIKLVDKDGFFFHAVCIDGRLTVSIATIFDPAKTPQLAWIISATARKTSERLFAKELYPRMYRYFEQVGNPVKKLKGEWAWTNYDDAKVQFDKLIEKGVSEDDAATMAVPFARTYKNYHRDRGFTKVVSAKHDPVKQRFHFEIEKE